MKIECGKIVSSPVTELTLDYTRMYIDGELEGELDFDVIKKAKKSVKITMPGGTKFDKDTFRQIIEATRNLENVDNIESIESLGISGNSNRQITIDLSETTADFNTIEGVNGGSGNTYRIQEGTEQIGAYSMYYNSVLTTLALPQSIPAENLAKTSKSN